MKISRCGYNHIYPEDFKVYRPHGTDDFVFLLMRSFGYVFLNGEKQIAPPNSVVLFNKNTTHLFGAYGENFIHDWVQFEADENELEWISELGLKFDTILELSSGSELSSIIYQMFLEFHSSRKNADEEAHLLLRLLFLKLSDIYNATRETHYSPWYVELTNLRADILSKPQVDWKINDIAQNLSISPSYLHRLYKLYFNKTVKEDAKNAKLEHAKNLLSSTNFTVSAISEQCGYQNDVHFMRLFKENVGMTPTAYRNAQREFKK